MQDLEEGDLQTERERRPIGERKGTYLYTSKGTSQTRRRALDVSPRHCGGIGKVRSSDRRLSNSHQSLFPKRDRRTHESIWESTEPEERTKEGHVLDHTRSSLRVPILVGNHDARDPLDLCETLDGTEVLPPGSLTACAAASDVGLGEQELVRTPLDKGADDVFKSSLLVIRFGGCEAEGEVGEQGGKVRGLERCRGGGGGRRDEEGE